MRLRLIVASHLAALAAVGGARARGRPPRRRRRGRMPCSGSGPDLDRRRRRRAGAAVEVIVAQEPDLPAVVAQVTFVDGGIADTVRREGRLTRRGLFFDLVGGGALVLTLESGVGSPGSSPAARTCRCGSGHST